MKHYTFPLLGLLLLCSCANHAQLQRIAKLPKELKENSGMAYYGGSSAWFVNDSGNPDKIYKVDFDGQLTHKFKVRKAKNRDWEELTTDKRGNLYIGDFGNNMNDREDLTIYIVPNPETEKGNKIEADKITFTYPEQKHFPPKKKDRMFDAEAFFHFNDHLYIFTKNRSEPFTGKTLLYKVPAKKGDYKAELVGQLNLCPDWDTCRVTSADISKDGKTVVLLGYGKLYLFTDFDSDHFFEGGRQEIDLGIRTQLESVCFYGENTLLLSDEEEKKGNGGGNLYTYQLK
ncbi:NHL repeat-containing protein [Pseudozobellia thermophila]|uniref:SdiA-regulated n=1 Tax=Pseudozobellia thermophila TaxID=192903 RepID=A0A1M6CWY0_9FLAO|nr:hypothetical protein [Pseudozobellia thermophila]SHI65497.1 hypothetical protein SAMN04488513_101907 [Pseudozobellia thermophila]